MGDCSSAFLGLQDEEDTLLAMIMNAPSNYNHISPDSSWPSFDSLAPQFIHSPPNLLNDIQDLAHFTHFAHFAQFNPILAKSPPYIGSTNLAEEDTNISANFLPIDLHLEHPNPNPNPNPSTFSPWTPTPTLTPILTPPKGQLLLKKCLLEMLPSMRDMNKPYKRYYFNEAMLMNGIGCTTATTTPTRQHDRISRHLYMLTERTRRRKQSEYFRDLGALLPGNPNNDKISILDCAIKHLRELKACNKDLKKHQAEDQSNTSALGGHLSTNTNIHGLPNIANNGVMVKSTITSSQYDHHQHSDHGLQYESTTSNTTIVSVNSTLQSDHSLCMNLLVSARLTSGSGQINNVLTCLGDLGLQVLSLQCTFEGGIFMAKISTRANKDSIWSEAQMQDALLNALLTRESRN